MNKFKRMMAMFLAVCMVLGVVPMQAAAAELGTKPADGTPVEVVLNVEESKTYTDNTGYYLNGTIEDTSVAEMKIIGSNTVKEKELKEVIAIESGKQYLISNTRAGTMLTNESYTSNAADWIGEVTGLLMEGTAAVDSTELWTITESGNGYTVMQDNQYVTFADKSAAMTSSETVLTFAYDTANARWTIKAGKVYLSDLAGDTLAGAFGYDSEDDGSYWKIYEIVENEISQAYTEITFTGISEGETTATVGNVIYNIEVVDNRVTKDIELKVGESKTVQIEGKNYSDADVTKEPDSAIAKIEKIEAKVKSEDVTIGEAVTSVSAGEYVIYTYLNAYVTNAADGNYIDYIDLATDYTVWNVEVADETAGTYYITDKDGKYLYVDNGSAGVTTTQTAVKLVYGTSTDGPGESGFFIQKADGSYNLNNSGATNYAYGKSGASGSWSRWQFKPYSETVEYDTEVTFTGVSEGNTTATVGDVIYNITVEKDDEVVNGNIADFNNIVGVDQYSDDNASIQYRSDLDMAGKVIKVLTISEGATFHVGVDVTDYESIKWTVEDESIASVDENGNVTGVKAGETTVTATVTKNGLTESISITVNVKESLVSAGQETAFIFYYIAEVANTTPYYTMFLSTESTSEPVYKFEPVAEGEVIYLLRPKASALGWVWTATPDDDYALAYMASTGTIAEYYPLKTSAGTLGSGIVNGVEYYKGRNGYDNIISVGNDAGASWQTQLDASLEESITTNYRSDGAMSNTRWDHDGVPNLVTSMTFISEPMPKITKTINGVLPTTRVKADFRAYQPGMVAAVSETVYFQIDITLQRPQAWAKNSTTQSAITYSAAELIDTALGNKKISYFYTKDLDNLDGKWDGIVVEANRVQVQDITAQLNEAWAEGEEEKVFTYYVLYEIQPDDIPKFQIDNVAEMTFGYSSDYSTGQFSGASKANATISVVGMAMDKVVVDFGQKVTLTNLTEEYLKDVYTGDNVKFTAQYGEAEVEMNADGTYTVVYTPTEIMQSQDAVVLYGLVNAGKEDEKEKAINGFTVYPATTMYYEEGFMFNENSTNWNTEKAVKVTKEQTLEYLGKSQFDQYSTMLGYVTDKKFNYGYDPAYNTSAGNSEETYSAGSYAMTSTMGARTTFDITGTGFEIYADCTTTTGCVSVQVKDAQGSTVKFFMIDTAALGNEGTATAGQAGNTYGTPIVSLRGLPYGKYTISVAKIMDEDPIYLDGLRVYNTVEDGSVFAIDGEVDPQFVEIRDMVLAGMNVDTNAYTNVSGDVVDIPEQVYNAAGTLQGVIVLGNKDQYTPDDMKELLKNGTKNELYLYPKQAITFTLNNGLHAQIGMHAPMGSTSYSLNGSTESVAVTSSTDMFYETVGGEIVITNTGDNVLSLTLLKLPSGYGVAPIFDEVGPENIAAAAFSLSRIEEGVYDKVPEEKKNVTDVFSDILNDWYTENVQYVFNNDIMTGIGGTDLFKPGASITKAQVAQILYNLEGHPYVFSKAVFEELGDVSETEWYADAVAWAYAAGIITGNTSTMEFSPNADITREQLSLMLYRYAQHKGYNTAKAKGFAGMGNADAVSEWAVDGMKWAVGKGIITGVDKDGMKDLAPKGDATRVQVATMVQRFCKGNNL